MLSEIVTNPSVSLMNTNKKKKRRTKKKNKTVSLNPTNDQSDHDDSDIDDFDVLNGSQTYEKESKMSMNVTLAVYAGNQMDDPVSLTIQEVLKRGTYSRDTVAACVNKMWDAGLKYDDPDSVLEELHKEEENSSMDDLLEDYTRPATAADVAAFSKAQRASTAANAASETVQPTSQAHIDPPSSPSPDVTPKAPTPSPPKTVTKTPPQVEQSLSAKLEQAACHQSLLDALIALESWASLMTTNAPSMFFDCQALECIIQRLLDSPDLIHKQEIQDVLVKLLSKVLLPSEPCDGKYLDVIRGVVGAVQRVAQQVSSASALRIPSSTAPLPIPISPVTTRLCTSIRRLHIVLSKHRIKNSGFTSTETLDSQLKDIVREIETVRSKKKDIKCIFELREVEHEATQLLLKKHEAVSRQQASKPASVSPAEVPSYITSTTATENMSLEGDILAATGVTRSQIDSVKIQASNTKSHFEQLYQDHEQRLLPYKTEISICNDRCMDLQQQRAYLLQQLHQVDTELKATEERSSAAQQKINEMQKTHDDLIGTMNSSHSHIVSTLNKDTQLSRLLQSVGEVDTSLVTLASIVTSSTVSSGTSTNQADVDTSNDSVIRRFNSYASSEKDCVEFLSKRIDLLENKVKHLHREISEYKNLGMQSLAADISQSIDKLQQNMAEDRDALKSIQESFCSTIRSIENVLGKDFSSVDLSSIHSIGKALSSCGLSLSDNLSRLMTVQIKPQDTESTGNCSSEKATQSSSSNSGRVAAANATSAAAAAVSVSPTEAPLPPRSKSKPTKTSEKPKSVTAANVRHVTPERSIPADKTHTGTTPPPGLTKGSPKSTWAGWGKPRGTDSSVPDSLVRIQAEQKEANKTALANEQKSIPTPDVQAQEEPISAQDDDELEDGEIRE